MKPVHADPTTTDRSDLRAGLKVLSVGIINKQTVCINLYTAENKKLPNIIAIGTNLAQQGFFGFASLTHGSRGFTAELYG